jgi:hypothetical protein
MYLPQQSMVLILTNDKRLLTYSITCCNKFLIIQPSHLETLVPQGIRAAKGARCFLVMERFVKDKLNHAMLLQ